MRQHTDSIDSQSVQLRDVTPQSPHQTYHAVLRGRVRKEARRLLEASDRRNESDTLGRRDLVGSRVLLVEAVLFFQVRNGQAGKV